MIITQLLGGMGNQMFQYAVGRHLALKNAHLLKLDTSVLLDWKPGRHFVNRDFDLDIFNIKPLIANRKDIANYSPQLMTKRGKIVYHLRKKLGLVNIVRETYFTFNSEILELKGDQYLTGLWQSYKYFVDIRDIIREDFTITMPMDKHSLQMLNEITKSNSVCINVRRGDYVSVKQTADILGFIGTQYYQDAISYIENQIIDPVFFIFSDDIDWCKQNLILTNRSVFYVDHSHAGIKFSSYLQLMQSCKNFIIPNSTFAWWAAWLCQTDNKLIISPKKWFNDPNLDTSDLIPPTWVRL